MKVSLNKKLIAAAAALMMAVAVPVAGLAADTIKIGVAGPHSGDLASYGLPTVNAAKIVAEQINAAGGINGKMIELLIEDTSVSLKSRPIRQPNSFQTVPRWYLAGSVPEPPRRRCPFTSMPVSW